MHATLLTLILVTGAAAADVDTNCDNDAKAVSSADGRHGGCDGCAEGGDSRRSQHLARGGLMPQSCYGPAYGCYPGNDRRMHRYPAFHGNYYRNPYNYRNEFDYPWHAGLHEPTSLFSYNVTSETTDRVNDSLPASRSNDDAPPPPQNMSSRRDLPSSVLKSQRTTER
jgi:hypothetical protein